MTRLLILFVLLAMPTLSISAQRPDAPPYGERGAYDVGVRDTRVDGRDTRMNVSIWYPAIAPEDDTRANYTLLPFLSVTGTAYRDAVVRVPERPYPLILFSHGSGGSRLLQTYLMEHLASYGFVVMAPDHPRNAFLERLAGTNDFPRSMAYRPDDLLHIIDFAEGLNDSGDFAGVIDLSRMGVGGHSFGGTTALQLGGARLNSDQLAAFCEAPPENENVCFLLDDMLEIAALRGLESVPEGNWPPLDDSRIKAVAAFAPWYGPIIDTEPMHSAVLFLAAAEDQTAPLERDTRSFANQLTTPYSLGVFSLAGHNLFIDDCPPIDISENLFNACTDLVWDKQRAHDIINHLTTAFFMLHLYGDPEVATALRSDAVNFRGLDYEIHYDGGLNPID